MTFANWFLAAAPILWRRLALSGLYCLSAFHGSTCCFAQPTEPTPEVAAKVPARAGSTEAVLNSLAAQDPQTPSELMRAVTLTQGLAAYPEAREYIQKINTLSLTAQQQDELYDQFGAGVMMRLIRDSDLAPEGRQLAMSILRGARSFRRDPSRLQQWIEDLGSDSAEQRRLAMARLAASGADAVAAIYRSFPEATPERYAHLSAALKVLGPKAQDALVAGLTAPDAVIQSESAAALGFPAAKPNAIHLIRPYFVGQREVQASASTALHRIGLGTPRSVDRAVGLLRTRAMEHLSGDSPLVTDDDGNVTMWTWDAQARNIVRRTMTGNTAAAVHASRLAKDIVELQPNVENTRLLLVSRLEVELRSYGLDDSLPRGNGSAYQLGSTLDLGQLNDVLRFSLEHGFDAAAIGASELLADLGNSSLLANLQSPLMVALHSPNRRVRFAAARSIMKIDPRHAFPGASYFLETLIDLAQATGDPQAIVVTPRGDVRAEIVGHLQGFGYASRVGDDGKHALQLASQSSDHDIIFLSESVNCPPVGETLQQLRKHPASKGTPVVLLVREGRMEFARQLASTDGLTLTMPEFADAETVANTIGRANMMLDDVAYVRATRRLEQAYDALTWLTHLAKYSQTYPWYDMMRASVVAENAAVVPGLEGNALELAGFLGGPSEQRLLIDAASLMTLPIEQRQQAANALTEAVLRRGLMLKKTEIYRQYDRYNASKAADTETQDVLGQVLDVIETYQTNNS